MDNRNINKISEQIKMSGITALDNFLNKENLDLASEFLDPDSFGSKGSKESYFPVFFNQYAIKLLKLDFDKIRKSIILKKIAKNLNFREIAENTLNNRAELHMIDCYFSEKSNHKIIKWHNDIGYNDNNFKNKEKNIKKFYETSNATLYQKKTSTSSRGIKFFIYLTDVQTDNGALAVIPFSNQIVKSITSLILEKKINLKPYWSLEDLRELVLENEVNKLLIEKIGEKKINIFLENTKFVSSREKDTTKFDLQMTKGGTVIFDELCIHRGSAPKKNNRVVLRFIYRKKI